MKNKFKRWAIMKLCDFGLWLLGHGPKDAEDREWEREFIRRWREAKRILG